MDQMHYKVGVTFIYLFSGHVDKTTI